ncbi:class I SAM-dependent methyltransferase [Candidatus Kuenenbacteria bacterium]|nr:class I SAM-dependent methyltransferase [Candidatus Kuenenbacteria bacterium]
MPQDTAWENEYKRPQLVTKDAKPQKDVLRFLKFLRKNANIDLENLNVLDLGSGTGRNANYLAERGNSAVGLEISATAVELAKSRAREMGLKVDYRLQSIGEKFPFDDGAFDIALDVTSSNSLNEKERDVYLSETHRVLKSGGYFFVKALCKDGDKNAKALIKNNPGPERDTYINKDMNLVERVFARQDFVDFYSKYFEVFSLEKKTNYTRFKGQSYKRNFWLAYLKRK